MDKNATHHLEDVLDDYRPFRFGSYFSEGISIWKKEAGSYIGFVAVYLVITMGLSMIPVLGQIGSSILVAPALTLGAAIFSYRTAFNEHREFGTFFDGFQFSKEIVIYGLIQFIIMVAIVFGALLMVGMSYFSMEAIDIIDNLSTFQASGSMILGMILLFCFLFYLTICMSMAPLFIGFYKLDAIESIRFGFKFGNRYIFPLIAFYIVLGLFASSGIILVFIGLLLTVSIAYPIMYAAFEDITDLEGYYADDSEDDIKIDDMFGA